MLDLGIAHAKLWFLSIDYIVSLLSAIKTIGLLECWYLVDTNDIRM